MKKYLRILPLVLTVLLLVACGDNGNENSPANQTRGQTESKNGQNISDAKKMLFDFIIRQDMQGTDVSVYQRYFDMEITWDGLSFEAASVFTREVQHHSGRYDVQEDVVISGKLSAEKKQLKSFRLETKEPV